MRVLEGWLPPLAVAALALAVYANSLDNSFHFDDQHSLDDLADALKVALRHP